MCLKKLLYNSDKYVLTGVKKPCMHLIVLLFSFYFSSLESISRPASCDTTRSRDQNLPQVSFQ